MVQILVKKLYNSALSRPPISQMFRTTMLILAAFAIGVHAFVFTWDCRKEIEDLIVTPYCAEADKLCRSVTKSPPLTLP